MKLFSYMVLLALTAIVLFATQGLAHHNGNVRLRAVTTYQTPVRVQARIIYPQVQTVNVPVQIQQPVQQPIQVQVQNHQCNPTVNVPVQAPVYQQPVQVQQVYQPVQAVRTFAVQRYHAPVRLRTQAVAVPVQVQRAHRVAVPAVRIDVPVRADVPVRQRTVIRRRGRVVRTRTIFR